MMVNNRQLILPYAAPYLAYVGIASISSDFMSMEINYLLRLIVTPLLLVWAWRWYCPLGGPRSSLGSIGVGAAAGIAGLILWLALLAPFVQADESASWSLQGFMLRLLCAGLIVPVFEELLMRGFVFRLALQWDVARKRKQAAPLHHALDEQTVNDVTPGAWSWAAVIISTAVFTSGHAIAEWPASVAYGLLMSWLWISRKDLIACITAHAVTNIALALFVYFTGSWQFW
jgi:uncharacterized protein